MTWRSHSCFGVLTAVAFLTPLAVGQTCDCPPGSGCDLSCLARPSDTGRYFGYYVGGGSPFRGEERCPWEGTYGWDYGGFHFVPRIDLLWNHGRYQGGVGAYRPNGPNFIEEHKEKKGE